MRFLQSIKSAFTMKRRGHLFTDMVSGEPVYEWIDCYGCIYMAGPFYLPGLFRVLKGWEQK